MDAQRAIEIFRRDSHDGRQLPVQLQRLPHSIGRRVQTVAPESIADHHHRRVATLVTLWTQDSSALRLHAHHRKIIRRHKLPEHALWSRIEIALISHIERYA